ncbi:MAG: tetratricopeptide repeat protein [Acidobacteriota bacterium]|nr:MAG: tetratricopeptide repeat protein [Acidobacteriota bacterium]
MSWLGNVFRSKRGSRPASSGSSEARAELIAQVQFQAALELAQRGDRHEAIAAFRLAAAAFRECGKRRGEAVCLHGEGAQHLLRGETDQAEQCTIRSLALHRACGDDEFIAPVVADLGAIVRRKGDLRQAIEYYTEALELYERLSDDAEIERCRKKIRKIERDIKLTQV